MNNNSGKIWIVKSVLKLYEKMCKKICKESSLTRFEVDILGFLYNHTEKDTASDIVEYRMIPKANVSQAVESLIQKKLLTRTADTNDRRRIHLSLTEDSKTISQSIKNMQNDFNSALFDGFTQKEQDLFKEMENRIGMNAQKFLLRK